ncbi:Cytochrome [Forsythia ovata]|uniref:Cytochrome n=1 Tax=Forsythia ovata TaxID=205694 RepID=A0ABD1RNA0_9LAMI
MAGKYLGNDYTSLATTSYGDHWRIMRRISSMEILSTQRLQMLQSIRTDEVKAMIRRLYRASETHQAVDMKIVFFELMMNVMMRMISGKSYYGENVEEIEEAKKFREIVIETFQLGGTSNMADFLPMLRWLGVGGVEKRLMVLQKKRDASMQELVEECRRRMRSSNGGNLDMGGKNKTMIEVLLTLQEKEPEYYTDGIIGILMLILPRAGTSQASGVFDKLGGRPPRNRRERREPAAPADRRIYLHNTSINPLRQKCHLLASRCRSRVRECDRPNGHSPQ